MISMVRSACYQFGTKLEIRDRFTCYQSGKKSDSDKDISPVIKLVTGERKEYAFERIKNRKREYRGHI